MQPQISTKLKVKRLESAKYIEWFEVFACKPSMSTSPSKPL